MDLRKVESGKLTARQLIDFIRKFSSVLTGFFIFGDRYFFISVGKIRPGHELSPGPFNAPAINQKRRRRVLFRGYSLKNESAPSGVQVFEYKGAKTHLG